MSFRSRKRRAALLATETRTGRGHVVNLATAARSAAFEFVIDAATPDQPWQSELLPFCRQVFVGPTLGHFTGEYMTHKGSTFDPVTVGDLLVLYGFRNKDYLSRQVRWWQDLMWRQKTELVIADYAPCALLAARALGIPTVNTGIALAVPPAGMKRFAPIVEGDGPYPQHDESETANAINLALSGHVVREITCLPDVFDCDLRIPCGFGFWDPYYYWRDGPYCSPLQRKSPESDGAGTEIFVYLSEHISQSGLLIEALGLTKLPVRVIGSGRQAAEIAHLRRLGMTAEPKPISLEAIVKQSRLIVCAGQAGTSALALLSGIPLIAIPQYKEQIANARGAVRRGVAKMIKHRDLADDTSARNLAGLITDAYRDKSLHDRAIDRAAQLRRTVEGDRVEAMRRMLVRVS